MIPSSNKHNVPYPVPSRSWSDEQPPYRPSVPVTLLPRSSTYGPLPGWAPPQNWGASHPHPPARVMPLGPPNTNTPPALQPGFFSRGPSAAHSEFDLFFTAPGKPPSLARQNLDANNDVRREIEITNAGFPYPGDLLMTRNEDTSSAAAKPAVPPRPYDPVSLPAVSRPNYPLPPPALPHPPLLGDSERSLSTPILPPKPPNDDDLRLRSRSVAYEGTLVSPTNATWNPPVPKTPVPPPPIVPPKNPLPRYGNLPPSLLSTTASTPGTPTSVSIPFAIPQTPIAFQDVWAAGISAVSSDGNKSMVSRTSSVTGSLALQGDPPYTHTISDSSAHVNPASLQSHMQGHHHARSLSELQIQEAIKLSFAEAKAGKSPSDVVAEVSSTDAELARALQDLDVHPSDWQTLLGDKAVTAQKERQEEGRRLKEEEEERKRMEEESERVARALAEEEERERQKENERIRREEAEIEEEKERLRLFEEEERIQHELVMAEQRRREEEDGRQRLFEAEIERARQEQEREQQRLEELEREQLRKLQEEYETELRRREEAERERERQLMEKVKMVEQEQRRREEEVQKARMEQERTDAELARRLDSGLDGEQQWKPEECEMERRRREEAEKAKKAEREQGQRDMERRREEELRRARLEQERIDEEVARKLQEEPESVRELELEQQRQLELELEKELRRRREAEQERERKLLEKAKKVEREQRQRERKRKEEEDEKRFRLGSEQQKRDEEIARGLQVELEQKEAEVKDTKNTEKRRGSGPVTDGGAGAQLYQHYAQRADEHTQGQGHARPKSSHGSTSTISSSWRSQRPKSSHGSVSSSSSSHMSTHPPMPTTRPQTLSYVSSSTPGATSSSVPPSSSAQGQPGISPGPSEFPPQYTDVFGNRKSTDLESNSPTSHFPDTQTNSRPHSHIHVNQNRPQSHQPQPKHQPSIEQFHPQSQSHPRPQRPQVQVQSSPRPGRSSSAVAASSPASVLREQENLNIGRSSSLGSSVPTGGRAGQLRVETSEDIAGYDILKGVAYGFNPPSIQRTPPSASGFPACPSFPGVFTLSQHGAQVPPLHIMATSWRHLISVLAMQDQTRLEADLTSIANNKERNQCLRVVVQFVKLPYTANIWHTVVHLTIDMPLPPAVPNVHKFTNGDTTTLPYSYTLLPPSSPHKLFLTPSPNASQVYVIPLSGTSPFPILPITLSNLALYLQSAMKDSKARRVQSDPTNSMRRLARFVGSFYFEEDGTDVGEGNIGSPGGSGSERVSNIVGGLLRKVVGRGRKENEGETVDYSEVITPFRLDQYTSLE